MPAARPTSKAVYIPSDYHTYAFRYLYSTYSGPIQAALIETGLELRRAKLRRRVRGKRPGTVEESWDLVRPYLDDIEIELERRLSKHSTAYWFHLYRRIAPAVSKLHDGKTDYVTAVLMRKIADQAMVRFAAERSDDLVMMEERAPNKLLGGYFAKSAQQIGAADVDVLYKMFNASGPRWVLADFDLNDFLEIHRLESLFYEYWRATATLRTIGKGAVACWKEERNWFSYESTVPGELYDLYDGRELSGGFQTLFGTWHPQRKRSDDGLCFVWAQYNSRGIYAEKAGGFLVPRATNFKVGVESLSHFWAANGFMAEKFLALHGVRLEALVFLLCALSSSMLVPPNVLVEHNPSAEIERLVDVNSLNLAMRAYRILSLSKDQIIERARSVASEFKGSITVPSEEELERSFEFLVYNKSKQRTVSLWANGKKYPLVPFGDGYIFDIVSVIDWLSGLFFGVRDKIGDKGFKFEDVFRQYLSDEGFDVAFFGDIEWPDGTKREVDALVRVGTTAVVLECVAAERPVDFEIAEPRRFAARKDILEAKAVQARSLRDKIVGSPIANNVNFDWAKDVRWAVVSHLPEFLWTTAFPCFDGPHESIVDPLTAAKLLRNI